MTPGCTNIIRVLAPSILLLGACTGTSATDLAAEQTAITSGTSVSMQIVAHQDDDFLFMSPDLQNSISNGYRVITVYLTAGESDGGEATSCHVEARRSEHAHNRQRAVRAAYARMAGVSPPYDNDALWTRDLYVPDPGVTWPHIVDRYTLNPAPQVTLIFMNMREDGEAIPRPSNVHTPAELFDHPELSSVTIVPSCGAWSSCTHTPSCPDVPAQNYSRAEVVTVLTNLLNLYQPTIVRTLDPHAFEAVAGGDNVCPGGGRYDVCWDNVDHRAAAHFADDAMAGYHGPSTSHRVMMSHYKGYSFINYPSNVGDAGYAAKFAAGEAYRTTKPTGAASGQADSAYHTAIYDPYYRAMHERYTGGTRWLERANTGALAAVNVEDRQVKLRYESSFGGTWVGPVNLGGGAPIAPTVTLLKLPDGRLEIFALRLPVGAEQEPATASVEIITSVQVGTTMTFGAWLSLGAPDADNFLSAPTAVVDGSGRIFVIARNSRGRLSYIVNASGAWGSWAPLVPIATEGMDVMEGVAAAVRTDGRVEVFATARNGKVQRFLQNGTTFTMSTLAEFNVGNAASAPTVAANEDGRLQIFVREPTGSACVTGPGCYGRVLTWWTNAAGAWVGPSVLFGDAGVGPVTAIRREGTGHIMLFERNTWSGLSIDQQTGPNAPFLTQWNLRGGVIEEYPAAATDSLGRVVVAAKGSDGKLYIQRESAATNVGAFGGWIQVAN